jgi:type II secretory pathway pseudopilin PulG
MVEVMISMAVLGFVLLAFMSIMTSASTLSSSTKESLLASYDLQSAVEDTMGQSFSNFQLNYTLSTAPNLTNLTYISQEPASDSFHKPIVTTPFNKYWDWTGATPQPRALKNEAVWLEILNGLGTDNPVQYRINIRWKSHKGSYQRDFIDMIRSSR